MTNDEVNKIIAEYMGAIFYETHDPAPVLILDGYEIKIKGFNKYTESLDALVPVWEKLGTHEMTVWNIHSVHGISAEVNKIIGEYNRDFSSDRKTVQEAAAHATAKAIISLNNQST